MKNTDQDNERHLNEILITKSIEQKLINQNKKIIIIEGNIGAGKTYFIENILLKQKIFSPKFENKTFENIFHHYKECVNERQLSKLSAKIVCFADDVPEAIIRFEDILIKKSLFNIKKSLSKKECAIYDRNFIGHYVFMLVYYFKGLINKYDLLDYEYTHEIDWKNKHLPIEKSKIIIIHLFRDVHECMINIKNRNRISDKYITIKYLLIIQLCYHSLYKHFGLLDDKTVIPYIMPKMHDSNPPVPFTFDDIKNLLIIERVKERIELYSYYEEFIKLDYITYSPLKLLER